MASRTCCAVCHASGPRASLPGRCGLCGAGEVEQVGAFGLVELECAGDAFQHGVGGAGEVPAFHPDVVVDAHAGQQRDLLAAQPFDAAVAAAVGGQTGLLGSDPLASGDEELPDLRSVVRSAVHDNQSRQRLPHMGGTAVTWKNRHSPRAATAP